MPEVMFEVTESFRAGDILSTADGDWEVVARGEVCNGGHYVVRHQDTGEVLPVYIRPAEVDGDANDPFVLQLIDVARGAFDRCWSDAAYHTLRAAQLAASTAEDTPAIITEVRRWIAASEQGEPCGVVLDMASCCCGCTPVDGASNTTLMDFQCLLDDLKEDRLRRSIQDRRMRAYACPPTDPAIIHHLQRLQRSN